MKRPVTDWIPLVLIGVALLARAVPLHTLHLPDPTLAALFVAGAAGLGAARLALIAIALVGIDGLKFALGASSACVSPGYPLLVVSYATLGAVGHLLRTRGLLAQISGLLAASALGYAISSGGYYLLSGRFSSPSWSEFGARMLTYLPSALFAAMAYGVVALGARRLLLAESSAGEVKAE
jgi:hypothetical protein